MTYGRRERESRGNEVTERDPLADADAVNQVRRAYAAKAARSDRALLITAQLIEIECLLTEGTVHTGAVPLDRTTVGELWLAVKDL